MEWRDNALCQTADPDIFFNKDRYWLAKQWCAACPVTKKCLDAAMVEEAENEVGVWRDREFRHGVRGGLVADERWKLAYPVEATEYLAREVARNLAWRERKRAKVNA